MSILDTGHSVEDHIAGLLIDPYVAKLLRETLTNGITSELIHNLESLPEIDDAAKPFLVEMLLCTAEQWSVGAQDEPQERTERYFAFRQQEKATWLRLFRSDAWRKLEGSHQRALAIAYGFDLPSDEIRTLAETARLLGIHENTLANYICKARGILRGVDPSLLFATKTVEQPKSRRTGGYFGKSVHTFTPDGFNHGRHIQVGMPYADSLKLLPTGNDLDLNQELLQRVADFLEARTADRARRDAEEEARHQRGEHRREQSKIRAEGLLDEFRDGKEERSRSPLGLFIKEIRGCSFLDRDEEIKCFKTISEEYGKIRETVCASSAICTILQIKDVDSLTESGLWLALTSRYQRRKGGIASDLSDDSEPYEIFSESLSRDVAIEYLAREIITRTIASMDFALSASGNAINQALQRIRENKERIIQANLVFVISVAQECKARGYPMALDDMISEGSIGLMKAVDRFDLNCGYTIRTYAWWWIFQSITRAVANTWRHIRLPVHIVEDISTLREAIAAAIQETGNHSDSEQLAKQLGWITGKVERTAHYMRIEVPTSLNQTINKEGTIELGDRLKDHAAKYPDEEILERQRTKKIMGLFGDSLSPRENEILFHRFLIDSDESETQGQIGKRFNLTRERIRQIEKGALQKLRRRANDEGLFSPDDF